MCRDLPPRRPRRARWQRRTPSISALAAALVAALVWVAAPAPPAAATVASTVGGAALARAGTVVRYGSRTPALPAVSATSFVVADATTGAILAARDAHGRLAPASTLKVLTADTLLPRLSPSATVKGSWTAETVDGTKVGIVAGKTYRVDALFTAMLMMSGNDAAISLADANGGVSTTIREMNAKATSLQAYDTHAGTVNGLDASGQYSSAYDLALLFRDGIELYSIPRFRHYLGLSSALFAPVGGTPYRIYTHDHLLGSYPGIIGGKNGYTIAAHASYVGAAKRNGHTIVVSVMRDVPDFWPEVTALLNWGFAADGTATPVGTLVNPR